LLRAGKGILLRLSRKGGWTATLRTDFVRLKRDISWSF